MAILYLPEPTDQQRAVLEHAARYKTVRAGRRGGKTRLAFIACTAGHGALPNGKGMLQGGQICWVPSTIPQSKAIWREEIEPRFSGLPGFKIEQQDRRVTSPSGGSLEIISAEGASAAQGRRFDGVFFDEPRDYELHYVWHSVFRPTLIDFQGWAILGSATRVGTYWNEICKKVESGRMGNNWQGWHWRTQDNPKLPPDEYAELLIEYEGQELAKQQELDALLLDGLAGNAFPEFDRSVHVIPPRVPARHWQYVAFLDWGYVKGCYGLAAIGPEGQIEIVYERLLQREHAREAARHTLTESSRWPLPKSISYDIAMDYDAGLKEGTTLRDEWIAGMIDVTGLEHLPSMRPAKHAPGSRAVGKNLVHKALKHALAKNASGLLEPWALPKLRLQQTCPYLISQLEHIALDERDPEKVATDGDDHGYDALRYLLATHGDVGQTLSAPERLAVDRSLGYNGDGTKRVQVAPWEKALRQREPEMTYPNIYQVPE